MAGGVQGYETQHLLCIFDPTPRKVYHQLQCKNLLRIEENEKSEFVFESNFPTTLCKTQM